jgi:cell wall assembly regulator SMI1
LSSLHEFATWEPLLKALRVSHAEALAAVGGQAGGQIGMRSWSIPMPPTFPKLGRALRPEDIPDQFDAVQRVRDALAEAGADTISFTAQISPDGKAALHLLDFGPAVEPGVSGPHPGALLLVEGAVPEPWRRLPEPVPGAAPSPGADAVTLDRALRERLPDAIGATEAELAAAEERLGIALPGELKALYRVTRARWEDWDDSYEIAARVFEEVGCELLSLDEVYVADTCSRPSSWRFASMEAVDTPPDAAVQGLVGSPGWIVFGDTGGGDRIAVDLTPGPGGHTGQIIVISHEESVGAGLVSDSLTELVLRVPRQPRGHRRRDEPPAVAWVNTRGVPGVEAAAHSGLEALSIGVWEAEPLSLAPVTGLPRLRTLQACPGTLADPLEIARLTHLEFLELAPEDWRVLLDADAVPRGLLAAGIEVRNDADPLPVVDLADEILALWDRPPVTRTVLEGRLASWE